MDEEAVKLSVRVLSQRHHAGTKGVETYTESFLTRPSKLSLPWILGCSSDEPPIEVDMMCADTRKLEGAKLGWLEKSEAEH